MEIMTSKNGGFYTLFLVSIIIVTGPSFISSTCISAPNCPVCNGFPKSDSICFIKASYKGIATSGFAAFI